MDDWISELYRAADRGEAASDIIETVRDVMKPVLEAPTMHGFAHRKPHGYSGDFEIIDRHYLTYIVPDPHLRTRTGIGNPVRRPKLFGIAKITFTTYSVGVLRPQRVTH